MQQFTGLFHNPFIVQTFAAHINIIAGSHEVLELYASDGITSRSEIPKARAGLALCAAAVCF